MRIRFLAPAQRELVEAVGYLNQQQAGLGDDFRDEAWNALSRIRSFPEAWRPLSNVIRRCPMRRFPYGILYAVSESEIVVIAVAHARRKPEYWQERT